jgi:hypothetical protein
MRSMRLVLLIAALQIRRPVALIPYQNAQKSARTRTSFVAALQIRRPVALIPYQNAQKSVQTSFVAALQIRRPVARLMPYQNA